MGINDFAYEEDPRFASIVATQSPDVVEHLRQSEILAIYGGARNGNNTTVMMSFEAANPNLLAQPVEILSAINWYESNVQGAAIEFNKLDLAVLGISPDSYGTFRGTVRNVAGDFVHIIRNREDLRMSNEKAQRILTERWEVARHNFMSYCSNNGIDPGSPVAVSLWSSSITKVYRGIGIPKNGGSANPVGIDGLINRNLAVDTEIILQKQVGEPILSSNFIAENKRGLSIIQPQFDELVEINNRIKSGGKGYIFCCPDYAREKQADGSYRYTMDGIGQGVGLTFERMQPIITEVIKKSAHVDDNSAPVNMRIGVADHEATIGNAKMVKFSGDDAGIMQFEECLNGSLDQMTVNLIDEFEAANLLCAVEVMDASTAIQERRLIVRSNDGTKVIAEIELGRVSTSFADIDDKGQFMDRINEMREYFIQEVNVANSNFQNRVDNTMAVRLNLMLNWANEQGVTIPDGFEFNGNMTPEEKVNFVLKLREESNKGNSSAQEFLTQMRQKIAAQGAEYFVMARLMSHDKSAWHMVGDSDTVWGAFGDPKFVDNYYGVRSDDIDTIPRFRVKGNYIGD